MSEADKVLEELANLHLKIDAAGRLLQDLVGTVSDLRHEFKVQGLETRAGFAEIRGELAELRASVAETRSSVNTMFDFLSDFRQEFAQHTHHEG